MNITLPFPPSANHYWRMGRCPYCYRTHKPTVSAEGRVYSRLVASLVKPGMSVDGRLRVLMKAFAADARLRDLDNLLEAPLDALQQAKFWLNDASIDDLRIVREAISVAEPRLELTVEPILLETVF